MQPPGSNTREAGTLVTSVLAVLPSQIRLKLTEGPGTIIHGAVGVPQPISNIVFKASTDVYVYGIIADIVTTGYVFTTNVDATLSIDNNLVATFKHDPQNRASYSYRQPMFSVHGLSASSHVVRLDLQPSSLFIFDYLIYTTPDLTLSPGFPSTATSSSSSSSSTTSPTSSSTSRSSISGSSGLSTLGLLSLTGESEARGTIASSQQTETPSNSNTSSRTMSTGALIGIIVGAVGLLLILGLLIYLLCTQRRRNERRDAAPYQSPQRAPLTVGAGDPMTSQTTSNSGNLVTFPQTFNNNISMTSIPHPYSAGALNEEIPSPFSSIMPPGGHWEMPSSYGAAIDMSNLNSKQRMMFQQQQHQGVVLAPIGAEPMPVWAMNRMSSLVSGDNTSSSGVSYSRAYDGEQRGSVVESSYPYNVHGLLVRQRSDGRSMTSGYPESVTTTTTTSEERISPRAALRSIRETRNRNAGMGTMMMTIPAPSRRSMEKDVSPFSDAALSSGHGHEEKAMMMTAGITEAEEELSSVIGRGMSSSGNDDEDDGDEISRPPTAPPPYIRSPPPGSHQSVPPPPMPPLPLNVGSNRI
ncbi:hypothetical protein FRC17_002445 [Serendipita sp. 399]|nr:hypothetical protein FRC17_002445 [Serendipita sp. 399]